MLFVGVAGNDGERSIMTGQLVELGAVRRRIDDPLPWAVRAQAIVVLNAARDTSEHHWPGLHIVIGAKPASDLDGTYEVLDALLVDGFGQFRLAVARRSRQRRTLPPSARSRVTPQPRSLDQTFKGLTVTFVHLHTLASGCLSSWRAWPLTAAAIARSRSSVSCR